MLFPTRDSPLSLRPDNELMRWLDCTYTRIANTEYVTELRVRRLCRGSRVKFVQVRFSNPALNYARALCTEEGEGLGTRLIISVLTDLLRPSADTTHSSTAPVVHSTELKKVVVGSTVVTLTTAASQPAIIARTLSHCCTLGIIYPSHAHAACAPTQGRPCTLWRQARLGKQSRSASPGWLAPSIGSQV